MSKPIYKLVLGAALVALAAPAIAKDDVKVNVPEVAAVLNGQLNTGDLVATLDSNIQGVGGDASATAAAIGNSLSVTMNSVGDLSGVGSVQKNTGDATARLTSRIDGIAGDASATAAAIGNSASVTIGVSVE